MARKYIDLRGRIEDDSLITLLRVEMDRSLDPYALVWYMEKVMGMPCNMRWDISRNCFIDHFKDQRKEAYLVRVTSQISEVIENDRITG